MRHERPRGNITILALFILLASSLIWVLIWLVMKNFIKYSKEISDYEKVNYLAKAGTELWLAIVGSRGVGFSYSISSGDSALMHNFSCENPQKSRDECLWKPAFSLEISGLAKTKWELPWIAEDCKIPENSTEVWPWFSVIVPLFSDQEATSSVAEALQPNTTVHPFNFNDLSMYWAGERKFGILAFNKNDSSLKIRKWEGDAWALHNGNLFYGLENYLIIANTSQQPQKLCLESNTVSIPQEEAKIMSIGSFWEKQLGTETFIAKKLPSFLQGDNYLND